MPGRNALAFSSSCVHPKTHAVGCPATCRLAGGCPNPFTAAGTRRAIWSDGHRRVAIGTGGSRSLVGSEELETTVKCAEDRRGMLGAASITLNIEGSIYRRHS